MSSTYTYPGVYIQELTSPVHAITGVATSVAAFVGYTATGIDNRAEMIFNFSDYQRQFGGLASNSELSYAVQQFFQNGGSQAWVVRTPGSYNSPSEQVYANVVFGSMTFSALSSGDWANGELLIDIDVQGLNLSSTTSPPGDPLSFNLTVTNLATGTPEYFPLLTLNANAQNFIANVLNDPDNGSQLVNVNVTSLPATPAPLTVSGVVGTALSITGASGVNQALGGSTTAATANADCSLVLNLPPSFPALPTIKVIGKGAPIPQSVQGLASQLQTAIGNAMVVQMPGASASCVAAPIWSSGVMTGMGIRVNVLLPNMPDAVVNFASPPAVTPAVNDAASALGLLAAGLLGGPVTSADVIALLAASPAAQNYTLEVDLPTTVIPIPVPVIVYAKGAPIPSSATPGGLAGIAADLETAVNNTLAAQIVGKPIVITGATGVYQALGGSPGPAPVDASADCDLTVNLPAPFPPTTPVTVITKSTPIPATVTLLATALQTALGALAGVAVVCTPIPSTSAPADGSIMVSATTATGLPVAISFSPPTTAAVNDAAAALGLEVPPLSFEVVCSVVSSGTGQAIEVTAVAADQADAAVSFTVYAPTPAIDAATALGLAPGTATTLAGPTSVNVAHYALGTNNPSMAETSSTPAVPMDGLPGTQQLIGDPLAQSGIYALSKVAFNLLCIPDAARASAGNPNVLDTYNTSIEPVPIYSAAVALCVQCRAMVLIDPPPTVTTVAAAVDWKTSTIGVFNANGAAFWPRLRLADALNNSQLRTFAPSGLVAGVYANTDTTRGVWKAPAGIGAVLNGVQNMTYQMSDAENGVLNPLGLNCFRTFPVYGPVLWGARTLLGADADANQWKYVPIRRVALFIESSLYQGTQWVVFEPNDEPLWSAIRLNVGSFMQNLFTEGFFQGQTPAQAYFVKCDSETTTQTDIDNGVVNIVVGFAPLYPAEFVVIQIQQITGQTAS
jgi:phage tail sheath protein FI